MARTLRRIVIAAAVLTALLVVINEHALPGPVGSGDDPRARQPWRPTVLLR